MSENRRRSIGRPKSSWIWEFFDSEIRDGDKWAICKLDKIGTDIPCKKEYKTCGSTKNCIDHLLNKHDLCKDGQKNNQVIIYFEIIHITKELIIRIAKEFLLKKFFFIANFSNHYQYQQEAQRNPST
jgi:hypothetical protein